MQAGGPEPRPDVQLTPRGAANTERNAYADKRLRRVADPSNVPGRAAAGMFGTCASGRGGPARNRCGRHEQCERDRVARTVRSRRVPRATPTRLIQLELEEDVPRHGLSLLLAPCVLSWALVRFDGAGMRLEVITASTCAQRPHHARSGDRDGTRSGQLSLWRAGTLFGRGGCRPWRAQVARSGRLGRGAWWWWQRACTWRAA